jgi:hypothetical protein
MPPDATLVIDKIFRLLREQHASYQRNKNRQGNAQPHHPCTQTGGSAARYQPIASGLCCAPMTAASCRAPSAPVGAVVPSERWHARRNASRDSDKMMETRRWSSTAEMPYLRRVACAKC